MRLNRCSLAVAALSLGGWISLSTFANASPTGLMPRNNNDISSPNNCTASSPTGPVFIDAKCVDPKYDDPTILTRSDLTLEGFPLHVVSGSFPSANINFTVYFPTPSSFQGRFIQFVYPISGPEARPEVLGSAIEFGAYVVQCSGTVGYRHEAAAAKYARQLAAEYYSADPSSFYGYIYGGSGGSFQTVGALENTKDVWQGAVPYVLAVQTSIPLGQDTIAFATLVLEDHLDAIKDAVRPGGSGDPKATLEEWQQKVFDEVSTLGVQARSWPLLLNYTWASGGLLGFYPSIKAIDPTYGADFWSVNGYLGTEQSEVGDFFRSKRVQGELSITNVTSSGVNVTSVSVELSTNFAPRGYDYYITFDNSSKPLIGALDLTTGVITVPPGAYNTSIPSGARVTYNNDYFLAAHALHRYQIPQRQGFYPWDQYRNADGSAIYPQRPVQVGPIISLASSGGGTQTGKPLFKSIFVGSTLDVNAFPWDADWYRNEVIRQTGSDKDLRVYFNDNADHQESGPNPNNDFAPFIVSYFPTLFQAIRDLAMWVEKGVEPPRNTQYSVDSRTQITVPADASKRGGIQPVVHITNVGGGNKQVANVGTGKQVSFNADAEVVTDGCIITAEWDYEGVGNWVKQDLKKAAKKVQVDGAYSYARAGTYFPALRVNSSRTCNVNERYVTLTNLDRVRVVVGSAHGCQGSGIK